MLENKSGFVTHHVYNEFFPGGKNEHETRNEITYSARTGINSSQ